MNKSNSELLNDMVSLMCKERGYAHSTGYLQSLVMGLSYGLSKKSNEIFRNDLIAMINKLKAESEQKEAA